jgi:hypothetical protein
VHQFGKGLFVEDLAGLARIGFDDRRIDLAVDRTDAVEFQRNSTDHDIGRRISQSRPAIGRSRRDQRCQAAAEAALFLR